MEHLGTQNVRNITIDIVKGIGIVLMVFYHAKSPGRDFVYLFHMALFFICSGYCYSHRSEEKPLLFIKKKIISLYLPCLISGLVVACLHNFFLDIHIYSYDVYSKYSFYDFTKQVIKCFAFSGGKQMLGANWFFRTLFISSILFMGVNYVLQKVFKKQKTIIIVRALICLTFTVVGAFLGYRLSFGKYLNCLTVMSLLDIGLIAKEYKLFKYLKSMSRKVLSAVLCFGFLMLLSKFGTISINNNTVIDPLFFILCSVFGFVLVYDIASFIEKSVFNKYFTYLGQKSIWIMFFHYIGFKIFTLIEIFALKEPISNLSAYPVHHTEHGLWFAYGVFGVGISMLFVYIGNRIIGKLVKSKIVN